ncbi:hypothetical protein [Nesterenkonia haasae]|uniref:hypothetical protein n=1 Tax=Nesterenkonia haasae TaxID=2587813 RepID=UPI001391A56C|nr:hypothetical protein [Nesterenkonia haasae]NDK32383.1 hypothetical protein [Nesterenkonia haasae]
MIIRVANRSIGALSGAVLIGMLALPNAVASDEELEVTEVNDVVQGDGYVVVYPETDAPPAAEEADLIDVGPVDDDEIVIIADSEGNLPQGLTPEAIVEQSNQADDTAVYTESYGEAGVGNEPMSACSTPGNETYVAGVGAWGPESDSDTALIGDHGVTTTYRFTPLPQTNAIVSGQGLGFLQVGANLYERRWYHIGSGYGGETQIRSGVPWGNVAGNPQLRAQSTSSSVGQWCHGLR